MGCSLAGQTACTGAALLCNDTMTDRATPTDDAALWTRDEITRLVSESGDAAETLSNLVRLIQQRFGTDVCSVYLLEPDRSTLVLAAHDRAARRERRQDPDAAHRGPGRPGRRADAAAGDRARDDAPALQVFPRGRRGPVSVVSRRAAGRPRAAAGRAGRADARPARLRPRRRAPARGRRPAAGPGRQRGAHAGTVRRAVAPAPVRAGPEPLVELGRRHDGAVPGARSGAVAPAGAQPGGAAAAHRHRRPAGARQPAGAAQPDQLRLPPDAGVPVVDQDVGQPARRACSGRGPSRTSRRSSACTSRSRSTRAAWASWRATTSRAPPISACRWSASASTTTRRTSGSGSTTTAISRRTTSTSTAACCRCSRPPMRPASR